jgi:hypothetical protein
MTDTFFINHQRSYLKALVRKGSNETRVIKHWFECKSTICSLNESHHINKLILYFYLYQKPEKKTPIQFNHKMIHLYCM